ncbi:malonyl-[acyl-carrier protein] O-methyltransferase BioC ['Osedax' symbiont bacterium Rs2_46_30_T18]|nr:malonyl-[acyl-carrier protein] O-methyltransferase BioC ['Osedax' symbiont bacterium Rs2_46_30_T18]
MAAIIDKIRVADSFSKAAGTYDKAAALQQDVGEQLLEWLDPSICATGRILDLGCGTGYFSRHLTDIYPHRDLICLDIAQGMLQHARSTRGLSGAHWLCADAEALPLAENSVAQLYSSLAIQWCSSLTQLFKELARVLNSGGSAVISSLGPSSLFELRESWADVDQNVHVNKFVALEEVLAALPVNLQVERQRREIRVLEYNKLSEITSELKNIGAHNMNVGENKGLTGRARVGKFKSNYESFRQKNGKLPATYEVYYLLLRKK